MNKISINGRAIGEGEPCYVIAELSANHNQSFDAAVELVHIAKECGADAVKLQTYTPDTMTIDCRREHFEIGKGTIWEGKNLYELYGEAYTPWEWQPKLMEIARSIGLDLFSSPFDASSVDFLEGMEVPAYKVASFELVDHALIRKCAGTGKPMIMSTGMATLAEIDEAVAVARAAGCEELALLKCTSAYPSPASEMNLRTIPHLGEAFGVVSGLSDHTLGIAVPVAAIGVGASIVEKHFTKSRAVEGPDSKFSLEPDELKEMVDSIRIAEEALGGVDYSLTGKEEASKVFRRSLFVVEDVAAGEEFSEKNVRCIRPGFGMAPKFLPEVLGRRASVAIERGTPLSWKHLG